MDAAGAASGNKKIPSPRTDKDPPERTRIPPERTRIPPERTGIPPNGQGSPPNGQGSPRTDKDPPERTRIPPNGQGSPRTDKDPPNGQGSPERTRITRERTRITRERTRIPPNGRRSPVNGHESPRMTPVIPVARVFVVEWTQEAWMPLNALTGRLAREQRTIDAMIAIYCRDHHGRRRGRCAECEELRSYAEQRLIHCPFEYRQADLRELHGALLPGRDARGDQSRHAPCRAPHAPPAPHPRRPAPVVRLEARGARPAPTEGVAGRIDAQVEDLCHPSGP